MKILALSLISVGLLSGCGENVPQLERPPLRIVATTGILECAVRELLPGEEAEVYVLIPPGSCPGHFDVAPETLVSVRGADVLLYHDFQDGLASRLQSVLPRNAQAVRLESGGSFNLPGKYLSLLDVVSGILTPYLDANSREQIASRLLASKQSLSELAKEMEASRDALNGHKVAVSAMQQEFTEHLGLVAVALLNRSETLTPADWKNLLSTDFHAVIGNLQSDAETAAALAAQTGKPFITLSNFPGAPGFGDSYIDHIRANLKRLRAELVENEQ